MTRRGGAGGENATYIFFFAFLPFRVCPEVAFFCIFLNLDATFAKEKLGHRVGSFIFFIGIFIPAPKAPEAFLYCNMRDL